VIVSDMRMPNMDGSQFMAEVMRRHPGNVRFILSGQPDQESMVRATRTIQRYLSKACDAATLKSSIRRNIEEIWRLALAHLNLRLAVA
jgi:response regulator RpfG family c-di-GMP phosphodiesterase